MLKHLILACCLSSSLWTNAQPKTGTFTLAGNYKNYVDSYYNFISESSKPAFSWNRFDAAAGYFFSSVFSAGIGMRYSNANSTPSLVVNQSGLYAYFNCTAPIYKKLFVTGNVSLGMGYRNTREDWWKASSFTYSNLSAHLGLSYFILPYAALDVQLGSLEFESMRHGPQVYDRVKPHFYRVGIGFSLYL